MIPSRKWIEQTIRNQQRLFFDLRAEGTDHAWVEEAAHAIAEKMAEGVVYKAQGSVATVAVHDGELTMIALNKDLGLLKLVDSKLRELDDGQRVRVTVTKEEGDAE